MTDRAFRRGCGDAGTYAMLTQDALRLAAEHPDPADRLQPLCDALWRALSPRGLSWIGFYLSGETPSAEPASADRGELLLAARRDKPACSPIGLHGACGQAFLEQRVRLIEDVALLGKGYIACDPRDQSEVVLPIYRNDMVWGVLDADSHEKACFGEDDVAGLARVLEAAGLLDRHIPIRFDRLRDSPDSL
jgi:putative methionine-R-sulfoxide reductase with GAF domain